jgi:serine protease Do/serine protease DegQ
MFVVAVIAGLGMMSVAVVMAQSNHPQQGHPAGAAAEQPVVAPTVAPIPSVPTLAPVIKPAMPAVVNISVKGHITQPVPDLFSDPFFRRFFDVPNDAQEREFESAGSGVIVDADRGYVITNNHVIEDADNISVTLSDDRHFDAELVGRDPETDLAVIKIPTRDLTAIPLGNSAELQVGDFVIAIGNPFGLAHTVTSGIVSAVGRSGLGIEGYEDFIQTDASINPGNSGGALLDLQGRLVGINTAIVGPTGGNVGIGFAIPINMVRDVMDALIAHGKVERGELGIMVRDLTPDVADAMGISARHGALVSQVLKHSAAERAGLKAGDVIVSMDGQAIHDGADLRNKVGLADVGQSVRLDVLRDGSSLVKAVTLTSKSVGRLDGATVDQRLSGATFGSTQRDQAEGVAVVEVRSDSRAYAAGLRAGDVITSVNRTRVDSLNAFQGAVQAADGALVLNIERGDMALFIVVE